MNVQELWRARAVEVETALDQMLPASTVGPARLHEAERYSALGAGKRLRGFLALSAAEAAGSAPALVMPAACAVEMIHAYSLIHDDLPCMDDDALRRGRPTNHKVYGEALALLAGDALFTEAFSCLVSGEARLGVTPDRIATAVAELAEAAGSRGMVGGQADDFLAEGRKLDLPALESIHRRKTGALIRACIRIGALLVGGSEPDLTALTRYAEKLGLAFQITDDLLDVVGETEKLGKQVGSDARHVKATYPRLLGLAESRQRAITAVGEAVAALAPLGERGVILSELAMLVRDRDH